MVGIIFIGPPCSGKSTIAKAVADRMNTVCISSGDIARSMANNNSKIAEILDDGGMAPEILMREKFMKAMTIICDSNVDTVVLDGFPRFTDQYKWLKNTFPTIKLVCVYVDTFVSVLLSRCRLRGRSDDKLDTFMSRMRYYIDNTLPILLDADNVIKVYNNDDRSIDYVSYEAVSKIRRVIDADNSKV